MNSTAYRAARDGAAIIDEPDRARIVAAGPDRGAYLQGLLTNDIQALTAGRGCYSAYLTAQGRMISDMYVLELGDAMLIDAPAIRRAELVEKFDQFLFSEDVQLGDATDRFVQAAIVGPRAADALAHAWDSSAAPDASTLRAFVEHQNARVDVAGNRVIVARRDDYGAPGFAIYVPSEIASTCFEAIFDGGAVPGDRDVAETLRVEAGRPLFGVDMDSDTIPLEAGIEDRAISFSKGCYVGQEVIIRVLHRGHGRVARKLVGLRIAGEVPSRGASVESDGKRVGNVTSAVRSPQLDASIALAYVQRDFVEPGTPVRVEVGGRMADAVVAALPFTRAVPLESTEPHAR
jgi:folate-binding protein YgfZ